MIKYALYCDNDHEFESWFAGSQAFETQVKRGLVDCPFCGSIKVSKALMAPSVSTSRKKEAARHARHYSRMQRVLSEVQADDAGGVPAAAAVPVPVAGEDIAKGPAVALLDDEQRALRKSIRELHAKVSETTTDVGANFADEARKMHDGEVPQKAIRGQASLEEAKDLWEDGIPVLPLPALPDGKN